ncbi:MAG: tyrosine-type recombinase/integrase [Candidatus Riflebacteria bacterium]|nr:tyrosine-type recombinase/integrase [Candidatus Riflebacteria bacterium]
MPIKAFFRWLTRNNYIPSNPAADLDLPKEEQRLPRSILSVEEVESILAAVDLNDPRGIRDRAILETFYSTGIRRQEMTRLKCADIDMKYGIVCVREGKGKKDRIIPIGERALAWINKYLVEIRPSYIVEPDEGYLFLTREGNFFTTVWMGALVRYYVRASGVSKRGSCHLFRHTMATLMLEGGASLRYIQKMLGHSKLSTTEIYTQVATRKLKEVYMATHPGARLKRESDIGKEAMAAGLIGDDDKQPLINTRIKKPDI